MDMKRVLLTSFLCISTVGGVNAGNIFSGTGSSPSSNGSWLHCGEVRWVNNLKITQPSSVSDEVWEKVVDKLIDLDLINQRRIQGLIIPLTPITFVVENYRNSYKYNYGYEIEIRIRVLSEHYSTRKRELCKKCNLREAKPCWSFFDGCCYVLCDAAGSRTLSPSGFPRNGCNVDFRLTEEMPRVELEKDVDRKKFFDFYDVNDVLTCLREYDCILISDDPSSIQKKLFRLALRQFMMRRYFSEYCERSSSTISENYKDIREQYLDAVDYFIENGNLIYGMYSSSISLNWEDMSPNIKLPNAK